MDEPESSLRRSLSGTPFPNICTVSEGPFQRGDAAHLVAHATGEEAFAAAMTALKSTYDTQVGREDSNADEMSASSQTQPRLRSRLSDEQVKALCLGDGECKFYKDV